ncbi:MAG: sulfurtransferase [Acidobacteria bacterium]|nr:sulfurtransferase [Acidobacteriota bacterium]HCV00493.1 sulfurtransferase [Dehalococcoidia bacterium]|tara:strand:- start:1069 stop:1932 length:864 start_codon:yes stop_codon:yes gene_type:complete
MTDIASRGYSNPDVLVSTDWVAEHLDDANVRIVESNEDQLLYPAGHIAGAVQVDWATDLNDQLRRDYLQREGFEELMSRNGITRDSTVVFYGDRNNWWATYAYWVFQLFGHSNSKVMDGGRQKWEQEGRDLVREVPSYEKTSYVAPDRSDAPIRAFREDVLGHLAEGGQLVDVRSPQEYSGERLHMPDFPNEGALRGGHIPTARNIPWARAANPEDGTFKTATELKDIYLNEQGLTPDDDTIAYCRIGERSSHTWFVLTHLLGFKNVRNYDGSWTEWGNLVNVPIEK